MKLVNKIQRKPVEYEERYVTIYVMPGTCLLARNDVWSSVKVSLAVRYAFGAGFEFLFKISARSSLFDVVACGPHTCIVC